MEENRKGNGVVTVKWHSASTQATYLRLWVHVYKLTQPNLTQRRQTWGHWQVHGRAETWCNSRLLYGFGHSDEQCPKILAKDADICLPHGWKGVMFESTQASITMQKWYIQCLAGQQHVMHTIAFYSVRVRLGRHQQEMIGHNDGYSGLLSQYEPARGMVSIDSFNWITRQSRHTVCCFRSKSNLY